MVTCNTVKGSDTILNSFVERERACKYVMHAGHSKRVMRRGEAGVGDVVFRAVVKEGIFDSHFVGSEYMEEIFATDIASRDAVWAKCFFMFVTMPDANPCIDVST